VRDAVSAYYTLVTHNPVGGEYYNIGGTYTCTIREMLDYLISISTKKNDIKTEIDPSRLRPIDADLQVPDTTKFEAHTGWKPKITFEQTMQDLLDYWRDRVSQSTEFLLR
jgi:nucleoside-diphosphate-sugar epimerase